MDNLWYHTFNRWNKYSSKLPFQYSIQVRKTKIAAKINIACSISIDASEQHVHQWMCIHSAVFTNVSLLQSEKLRQKNVSWFLGAQSKQKNIGKHMEIKVSSAPSPGQQLLGVYIL